MRPADILFPNLQPTIDAGKCFACKKDATEFTDEISEKEFKLSGMCQTCQDGFFNSEE